MKVRKKTADVCSEKLKLVSFLLETESYCQHGHESLRARGSFGCQRQEQTFQELICQEKPQARWTLKMDGGNLRPNCVAQGWRQYQQRGFGRYVSPV